MPRAHGCAGAACVSFVRHMFISCHHQAPLVLSDIDLCVTSYAPYGSWIHRKKGSRKNVGCVIHNAPWPPSSASGAFGYRPVRNELRTLRMVDPPEKGLPQKRRVRYS